MNWKFHHPLFQYEKMYTDLGGPWAGHKYFAYDLIRNFKPKKIVELGTHLGCSLFSFSQAVKDDKLKTKLEAIDTWIGDEHAGFYGEIIIDRVKEIQRACYPKVNIKLVRKTFDEAVNDYPDNSIDVLHIDGLHTYKAVKHDYETWYKKVKKDGIILLHDVAVKKWGFGIYKLFEEIKKTHKTIEFTHSFGLGVIFKDDKTYSSIQDAVHLFPHYYSAVAEKEQLKWEFAEQKKKLEESESKINRIKATPIFKVWKLYKGTKSFLIH